MEFDCARDLRNCATDPQECARDPTWLRPKWSLTAPRSYLKIKDSVKQQDKIMFFLLAQSNSICTFTK